MGLLGGLLSGVGSFVGAGANFLSAYSTYKGVKDNIKTNDLNYRLQLDNLAYQKDLQKVIFAREDNAVQRRVNDLRSAGLSPTLAAGSSASAGPVIGTTAPQKVSNLEGYMALAQVGTMLANQQKAQTEADIARQKLKQSALDTKYYVDRGLAPVEVNQDWKSRLLNLLYPKLEDALFGKDSKSGLFGKISESFVNDLSNQPPSGVTVGKDGVVTKPNGQFITSGQASVLKSKGLYKEWLAVGFSPRVVNALRLPRTSTGHVSNRKVVHGGGSIGTW